MARNTLQSQVELALGMLSPEPTPYANFKADAESAGVGREAIRRVLHEKAVKYGHTASGLAIWKEG